MYSLIILKKFKYSAIFIIFFDKKKYSKYS